MATRKQRNHQMSLGWSMFGLVGWVGLMLVLLNACAAHQQLSDAHQAIETAKTTVHDRAADDTVKATDSNSHAEHAAQMAPAAKPDLQAITTNDNSIIANSIVLETVVGQLTDANAAVAAKDKQIADLIADVAKWKADAQSGWRHVLDLMVVLGTAAIPAAIVMFYLGDVTPAIITGLCGAGLAAAAITYLQFTIQIEIGFLVLVGGVVAYLLFTKTTAITQLVQLGEHVKDELATLGTAGVAKIKTIFGHGTSASVASNVQSKTTQKIVAKVRGKKTTAVRLAAPLVGVTPALAA